VNILAALFITAGVEGWKQTICASTDEWINKMWYIHAVKYYLAIRRNEVLRHATTWLHLENIMLSESQTAINDHRVNCFISMKCSQQANLSRQKAEQWFHRATGRGVDRNRRGLTANRNGLYFGEVMKIF
jgi:hypothetical protein